MTNYCFEKPILSYREISHSLKLLSFFSHYTAPLYGFTSIEFTKSFLPILLCIEGLVYEADYLIEVGQKDADSFNDIAPWLDNKKIMIDLFKQLNLYTPMIEQEADNLSTYWKLENQMMLGSEITHDMLLKAIELRASDVMVMHHICQGLTSQVFNQDVWQAIGAIEVIRDIEADLRQYEADIIADDFNIYRMYLKVYGPKAYQMMTLELEERKRDYWKKVDLLSSEFNAKFKDLSDRYEQVRPAIEVPEPIFT